MSPSARQAPPEDTTIVATFADETIHMDEFERQYVRTIGSLEQARNDSLGKYADFLERYVNFRVKLLDAKRRGLDANLYSEADMSTQPGQLAQSFLVSEARSDLLHELYERRREDADVSVISVRIGSDPSPQDTLRAYNNIRSIRDSIAAGMPFSEAAVEFSDAPTAEQDSGRVGYVPAGRAYRAFENRMYTTPVGDISEPFRARGSYYLMKVHDRRPAYPERRISHIMLTSDNGDTSTVYKNLESLRDSLEDGKDFARLARLYSAHTESASQGGDLGWNSYMDMHKAVPEFTESLWAIDSIGVVADNILKSRFGYHLVKITEERDYSSLEAARPHLEERLDELPRSKNLERKTANRLLRQYGGTVDSAVVEQAVAELPNEDRWSTLLENGFTADQRSRVFASIGDSTYTLGQLSETLQEARQDTSVTAKVYENVKRFLRDKAYAYTVPGLRAENPEFRRILREYENGVLLFKASEETVWKRAQQDTAALRALYEESGDQYRWPQRYRTIVFRTYVDSTLKPVIRALDAGQDVASIHEQLRSSESDVRVDTVFVSDSTSVYGRALDMTPGAHSGIVSQGARDMVLLLDAIEEPRRKTFEEARTDLVRQYQQQLEHEWVSDLHDRYDVRMYPERLRYAFTDSSISDEPVNNPMPSGVVSD